MSLPHAKSLFALDPATTYLNHCGFGATPLAVTAAKIEKLKQVEANPTRFFGADYSAAWQSATDLVAARFKLRAQDMALVDNITDGANAVLRSLAFAPGDEILTTSMVYGSIHKAASYTASRNGATVRRIGLRFPDPDPAQFLKAMREALTPRTKLVILDHIAPGTALVMPVAGMAKTCREHGVPVLIDGAHVPGNIAFDIPATGADWYVANLHKWYFVPRGCGFLWAAPHRHAGLVPAVLSWNIDKPFPDSFEWTGTRDPGAWLSIPDAFAFMDRFGEENVRRHNHALLRQGLDLLADAFQTTRNAPDTMTGSMGLVRLPGGMPYPCNDDGRKRIENDLWTSHNVIAGATFVDAERIWLRVSAQIYNSIDDYKKLARAVHALKRTVR